MAVFSSAGIDYPQVMRMTAVVGVERSIIGDRYWGFSLHLADGFILERDHRGTTIEDVRIGWS